LFFTANDPVNGEQLWVSDGKPNGTHPVAAVATPSDLTSFDGKLFFSASDPAHGQELWESDGTAAGTFMVQDLNPGPAGSGPFELTPVKNTLFFSAADQAHGRELWAYNPSPHFGAMTASSLATGGSPGSRREDVSPSVVAVLLPAFQNPQPGLYNGTILVESLPRTDPTGPTFVVLQGLPQGVTLTAASVDGHSLAIGQTASGDYEITLPPGTLRRHPVLTVAVTFSDPLGLPIRAWPKVFAEEGDE
jgi:ELWxxDGT repeat protein